MKKSQSTRERLLSELRKIAPHCSRESADKIIQAAEEQGLSVEALVAEIVQDWLKVTTKPRRKRKPKARR